MSVTEATKPVMEAGDYDVFLSAYSVPNGDADYLFRRFLRSDAPWNVERRLGYRDAEFDELVDRAATRTDPAGRRELYHRIQRLLAADRPMIPLAYQDNPVVTTTGVGGVTQNVAYVTDLGRLAPRK